MAMCPFCSSSPHPAASFAIRSETAACTTDTSTMKHTTSRQQERQEEGAGTSEDVPLAHIGTSCTPNDTNTSFSNLGQLWPFLALRNINTCHCMAQPWMQPWIVPQRLPVQFSSPPGHSHSTSMSGCTPEGHRHAAARLMCGAGRVKRRRYNPAIHPNPNLEQPTLANTSWQSLHPCAAKQVQLIAQRLKGSRS